MNGKKPPAIVIQLLLYGSFCNFYFGISSVFFLLLKEMKLKHFK